MLIDSDKLIQWLEHKFYESYMMMQVSHGDIFPDAITEEMKAYDTLIRKIKNDCALDEYNKVVKGEEN